MALAVPSTDHAAGRIPKLAHFRKAYTKGIPSCARGRIPGPALVFGRLLYSPGSHGGHIKWPPARAELATNLTPVPPGPGIRRARRGNVTCQKGTGLFWSVLSGETSRSNGDLLSPVAWKSAALSEVCGKFWTRRAHRGFAIINPQVERLSIYGVVDPSRFCRILQECRRISCGLTAHLPQRRPLPLVESGPKSYE